MSELSQEFTIHPVGQGLFYSGTLKTPAGGFRMVMDCGSLSGASTIRSEADVFRNEQLLGQNVLDLLVISHFDADHVNHVKYLLRGGVQVRRLVMPFLGFAERLFLVLKRVETSSGPGPDDPDGDAAIRFAIDPIGELGPNLGGDSEIYLVESDDAPIEPDQGNLSDGDTALPERGERNEPSFVFDYDDKAGLGEAELNEAGFDGSGAKLFKVYDSKKGHVSETTSLLRLMDFLFYKRPLKSIEKEKEFYDRVFSLFCDKFDLKVTDPDFKNKAVEAVISLGGGTIVKEWFRQAADKSRLPVTTLANLNTTALCLLHRNLPGLMDLIYGSKWRNPVNGYYNDCRVDFNLFELHVFKGHASRLQQSNRRWIYGDDFYRHPNADRIFIYPNVLLTSDSFLYTDTQVELFTNKYRAYREDFWLMQLPHHGSSHNLHSLLPKNWYPRFRDASYFINYGLNNRDDHPDQEIINLLQGERFFPVHERQGLEFRLGLYNGGY